MAKSSLDKFLHTARQVAHSVGQYQLRHFGGVQEVSYKGVINLVTRIDKESEKKILSGLRDKYPDHDYVTEESDIAQRGRPMRWIIDPLDGTTNYAHGYPMFCVSMALEIEGQIRVGVVYAPYADEMFFASAGRGAWLLRHNRRKRLAVSRTAKLEKAMLVTGFPYTVRRQPWPHFRLFEHFVMHSEGVRRDGSAALNLCYLAAGRFDGFWELNLNPWDTAAGALMIEEAGGKNSDFSGGAFAPRMKEIVSSNGRVHGEILKNIAAGKKAPSGHYCDRRPG